MTDAVPAWVAQGATAEEENLKAASVAAEGSSNLADLATAMVRMKEEIDALEEARKNAQAKYDTLRKMDLPDAMRAAGLVSGNRGSFTAAGGKIHLETKVYASYDKEQQDEVFEWLRTHGLPDIIKESVNASTLSSVVRERRDEGLPDIPNVKVFEETMAKFVRSRS